MPGFALTVKCPAESVIEKLFVPFMTTVAPERAMPSLPATLPFITGWENTDPAMKNKNHRKKRIDPGGLGKKKMLLIKSFILT